MFNRKFLVLVLFIICINYSDAQILGIGTTNPNASSILDLGDTTRGFIVPRMTLVQRGAISSPATGLLIYQTKDTPGFYYNSGTPGTPVWSYMTTPSFWGDPPRMGFWGPGGTYIISNTELSWDTNYSRIGIGTIAPSSKLHIIGTSDDVLLKVAANATQGTDIMKITDGSTGARFFTFDNNGRMIVRGQGTTTSANRFHLTAYNGNPTTSITTSFFEIDCDATTGSELVIRLSESNASTRPALMFLKSSGTLAVPTNMATNNQISYMSYYGYLNASWNELAVVRSYYRGSGTTLLADMRFFTSNAGAPTEKMRIDYTGDIGINSTTFSGVAGTREKLLLQSTTLNAIYGYGNINNTIKFNIRNLSSGNDASSDIVATNNTGTEANNNNYINLGINSSGYSNATYSITSANDGYLYNMGNNLVIGTDASSHFEAIKLITGGTLSSNERVTFVNGCIGIGTTAPDMSSVLDISSDSMGILIPRMTVAQRGAITVGGTTNGLLVYQTNGTPGFYYYQAGWDTISSSSLTYAAGTGLTLTGLTFSLNIPLPMTSAGTGVTTFTSGRLLIGLGTSSPTTNANLFWDYTNSRLGIGTTAPATLLDVHGTATLGANGTEINNIIKATVNKDIGNVASNSQVTEYFVISNADTNTRVAISPANALNNGIVICYARIFNFDTIEVMFRNVTGAAINPASTDFYITLFH